MCARSQRIKDLDELEEELADLGRELDSLGKHCRTDSLGKAADVVWEEEADE